ncbi:MAG: type I secretion C-terminal target domain-containing protein [Ahrensia sp.]|nr:type I secretion C-terminal target domain-containing protein [Ahrensia sp.]
MRGFAGDDIILGGDGNDFIRGGAGDDQITGGTGADLLVGKDGADTFIWQAMDILLGETDRITDFSVAETDVLSLDGLLAAFNAGSDAISDFVNLSVQSGDTIVQIDQSGAGNFSVDVVTLSGVTGLDLATLYANGNLTA